MTLEGFWVGEFRGKRTEEDRREGAVAVGMEKYEQRKKEDKACRQAVWRRRESEESYEELGANLSLPFSTFGAQFAHLYNVFN